MKLIGLVTTVIILGAIYLFFVKPVTDTVSHSIDTVNDSINSALDAGDFNTVTHEIEKSDLSQEKTDRALDCIDRVKPDKTKMQNCVDKYGL